MKEFLYRAITTTHRFFLESFFSRLYCAVIVTPQKTKRTKSNGITCVFHIPNSYVNWYVSNFESVSKNEKAIHDVLLSQVKDGDVVYDIGANIGGYIIWLGRRFKLKQLVAFEPETMNYSELTKNIRLNKLDNAIAMPVAASNRSGYEPFFYMDEKQGNANGFLGDYEAPDRAYSWKQMVRLEKIDSLVSGKIILPPDVLLIDVDGGELSALEGMRDSLGSCRLISVEVSEETKDGVDSLLRNHGYDLLLEKTQRRANRTYVKNI